MKVTKAEDIVYCVTNVKQIIDHSLDFVFTDGHAVDSSSEFYYPADAAKIKTVIDPKAIIRKYWKDENDLDLKRRKEAEFLVEGDIPSSALDGFVVYNDSAKKRLTDFGLNKDDIQVEPDFYF